MSRWIIEYSVMVPRGTDPEQQDEKKYRDTYEKNAICGKFQIFYQVIYLTHVLQPYIRTNLT